MGRTDRTSLLALAYMPPTESDDEDVPPSNQRGRPEYRTAAEEEYHHDMNDLADYDGDSDDESPGADAVLQTLRSQREDDAAEVNDDGFTACNDVVSEEEQRNAQMSVNAPLSLPGAPVGWRVPAAQESWKEPKPKTTLGQPNAKFDTVDNPGGWSLFTFRPKFLYKGKTPSKCLYYALPTDATPVPKDDRGKRTTAGFEFFYNGWTKPSSDPTF